MALRPATLLLLGLLASVVSAEDKPLYRHLDADGVVHYSDRSPHKTARPYNVKKDYSAQLLQLPPTPRFGVHFDTPTPGQIYRNGAAVDIAMSVMPGLISSFALQLKVNGDNYGAQPLKETRTTLPHLGAGTHTLVAVLLNSKGQELTRSGPLKIVVQPAPATP